MALRPAAPTHRVQDRMHAPGAAGHRTAFHRLKAPTGTTLARLLHVCMLSCMLTKSAPGMLEEAPRKDAEWPGIQATTVTKAMPAHPSITVSVDT